MDMASVIDAEFADVKRLVVPGSRKRLEAQARVRALAIVEASLAGERTQPTDGELRKHVQAIQAGKKWNELFPGVASLRLDTSGTGQRFAPHHQVRGRTYPPSF